ncbi:hypothetical protein LC087_17120 [Bacillus carboniphilus]|uniref:Uncharacterized protein n=1 Tax=Bacillus carboniphilus TaxID=86663 RepID=A0ABY9JSS4_9BACI|nr:hypothetical protein [Bacillus carboniphilus]WLR42402.1 hypothetical protein LC087_17120 [Bacillus carboniphilus]
MAFVLILNGFAWSNLLNTNDDDRYHKILDENLSVVGMDDINNEANYERDDHESYFLKDSSLFVHAYEELYEVVEFKDRQWNHMNMEYRPSLISERYDIKTTWLAKRFVNDLMDKRSFNKNFQPLDNRTFDELWINEDGLKKAIIARKENVVYYIEYLGEESIEELIEVTSKKTNHQ